MILTKNADSEDVDKAVYSGREPYEGVEVPHVPLHPCPPRHQRRPSARLL